MARRRGDWAGVPCPITGDPQRVVADEGTGDPWFVAADVCRIFLAAQRMNVVPEAGLYRLVMRSDRPEARRFQGCVVGFVVATLRQKGV